MNYFLIYKQEDEGDVNERLLSFFDPATISTMEWPENGDLSYVKKEGQVCITWLPEKELRTLLTQAVDQNCLLAILPHPEAKKMVHDLGIEEDEETIIRNLAKIEKPSQQELLFCNGEPVFNSIRTGSIFEWEYGVSDQRIWKKLLTFFSRLSLIRQLSYKPYTVSIDGEKVAETAAMGIFAIEQAANSMITRHWATEQGVSDGHFHFFIVSPQNLYDLARYVFRSLLSSPKANPFKPDFIGYIKAAKLELTSSGPLKYLLDDQEKEAEKLELEVHSEAFMFLQQSKFAVQEHREGDKKSIRIKGIPAGERKTALIGRKIPVLPRATAEDFKGLFTTLRENAATSQSFLVMIILSTLIATLGLYANSSPVIIGAMILAPLMAPIVSFSMGLIRYDTSLMISSSRTILFGSLTGLAVGVLVSLLLPMQVITEEIHARLSPNLLDLGIAVASGVAAAYAHAKEGIAQSLAGVAIAVALVPPLAVTGIGLGWMDWHIFSGSFLLFLTNLAGIILFAGISFLMLGFAPFKTAGKGLLYTLLIVLILAIPLSISFSRITEEARIIEMLEGYTNGQFTIRDVDVRQGDDILITIRLVSQEALSDEDLSQIKTELSDRIKRNVKIQIISILELR